MKFASVLHTLATGLAAATSTDQICAMTLDAVQHALAVERASVLLFDEDGVMRFRAWTGLSDEYRQTVDGHSPWRPDTVNPTPVLVPDVEVEPGMAAYLDAFRRERIRALAFIPLSAGRRTIGKFMLYWASPHALDDASLDAARALGALMTLAMERHARDLESRQREQHILFALDAANMGTWQWEIKSGQVHWSQNMERLHGLAPGTFDGAFDSYLAEIHPEDRDRVLASATRALHEGVPHDVEYRIVSPEGVVRWVHGKGRVEYDEAGVRRADVGRVHGHQRPQDGRDRERDPVRARRVGARPGSRRPRAPDAPGRGLARAARLAERRLDRRRRPGPGPAVDRRPTATPCGGCRAASGAWWPAPASARTSPPTRFRRKGTARPARSRSSSPMSTRRRASNIARAPTPAKACAR